MRFAAGCLLLLVFVQCRCRSQDFEEPVMASSDPASLASEEAKRGAYVFYTESFIDKENKRASYRGSVYGGIQALKLNGCELKIETIIVDKFSGTVGRASTGEQQDTNHNSASVLLTPEIAAGLAILDARPAQLRHTTHAVCDENPSCSFTWLRIQAKHPIIQETSTVNDSLDFSGQVDQFVIPISSRGAGNRLIRAIRALADSECR